jgi:hypothetical protein
MTVQLPERVDPETLSIEDLDFEVVCEIASLRSEGETQFPPCRGDAARWVAWRANCCPGSPRYRLLCDYCKSVYQAWMAKQAYLWCGVCGAETGGFISFTPLEGKS